MRITGSVALVTGGASGLGGATTRRLAAAGATVVVADLASSNGEAIADALGGSCIFQPTDVSAAEDVERAVASAADLGELRVLVNCAGVATPGRVLGREGPLPLEDFTRVVTVNLIGTFNAVRLATARMEHYDDLDGDRGVVVNTASVAAFDGQIGQAAYAASKSGVAGMTLPLARDLASRHIRVMTIAPGIFETPMMAGLTPEAQESLRHQTLHPARLGRPEEYAALVEHVIANPMLNGEVIRLDGAIRLPPR